jgi:hypothetical protein
LNELEQTIAPEMDRNKSNDQPSKHKGQDIPGRLVVVPGNHDVRLSGIIPVNWFFAIIFLLFASSWAFIFKSLQWTVLLPTAFILITLQLGCFADFFRALGKYAIRTHAFYPDLGIVVYSFDSASAGPHLWARGKITNRQFLACHTRDYPGFFKVAVVHHHPLPIPYEHNKERLLLMDNAGAFLNEISSLQVRLVLHGHRHHQHCSRVMINLGGGEAEYDIAVVSRYSYSGKRSWQVRF